MDAAVDPIVDVEDGGDADAGSPSTSRSPRAGVTNMVSQGALGAVISSYACEGIKGLNSEAG